MPNDANTKQLTDKEIAAAVADAKKIADTTLASREASLTRLTEADLQALFPDPGDSRRANELLAIVRARTSEAEKVNALVAKIDALAPVVVKLLGGLV